MNSAHNTLIQFLHDNPNYALKVVMRYSGCWVVDVRHPTGRIHFTGSGSSYEAACADLVARFPNP